MTLIDVIVVNHGTPQLFQECVASLEKFMDVEYNLIDIDNSPSDHVAKHVIENKGYAHAINYGASLGSAPYLLALNADTAMLPTSNLQGMLQLLYEEPHLAAVGPKQVNLMGQIVSAGCPPVPTAVGYVIRGWKERDRGQYAERRLECKYVAGSIMLMPRSVFELVGGFTFTPLFYEETGYSYIARHRGHPTVYTGQSVWLHHWNSSPQPDKHLASGRPIAKQSYAIFVEALRAEGIPEHEIPPFV